MPWRCARLRPPTHALESLPPPHTRRLPRHERRACMATWDSARRGRRRSSRAGEAAGGAQPQALWGHITSRYRLPPRRETADRLTPEPRANPARPLRRGNARPRSAGNGGSTHQVEKRLRLAVSTLRTRQVFLSSSMTGVRSLRCVARTTIRRCTRTCAAAAVMDVSPATTIARP
jgi:hypothetical protein